MNNEVNKDLNMVDNKNEKGASLVEYALLTALIAVVCIIALRTLGTTVSQQFSNVADQVAS